MARSKRLSIAQAKANFLSASGSNLHAPSYSLWYLRKSESESFGMQNVCAVITPVIIRDRKKRITFFIIIVFCVIVLAKVVIIFS